MKKINLPKYISGPSSFYDLELNGVRTLLFGDYHDGNEGLCKEPCSILKKSSKEPVIKNKSDECYSLNAWIKKELDFLEDTNEYLDLYVENKYTYTQEDVIINNPQKNSSRRIDELDKFISKYQKDRKY